MGSASPFLVEHTEGALPYGLTNTEAYRALNPHGRIPMVTLPDANTPDTALWESHSIVRYLADTRNATHLYGASSDDGDELALRRALCSRWMDWALHGNDYEPSFPTANHHLVDALTRVPRGKVVDLARIEKAQNEYVRLFDLLEKAIEDTRVPLGVCENTFTVADVPIAVEVNRFSLAMHALAAELGTEGESAASSWPNLHAFYERMLARPAFVRAVYIPEVIANAARLLIAQSPDGDGYGEWNGREGLPEWSDAVYRDVDQYKWLCCAPA